MTLSIALVAALLEHPALSHLQKVGVTTSDTWHSTGTVRQRD